MLRTFDKTFSSRVIAQGITYFSIISRQGSFHVTIDYTPQEEIDASTSPEVEGKFPGIRVWIVTLESLQIELQALCKCARHEG